MSPIYTHSYSGGGSSMSVLHNANIVVALWQRCEDIVEASVVVLACCSAEAVL
jgi:hypothetical protein